MELLRFILAAIFLCSGLFVLGVATYGLFKLDYVLNRIHASAKCDTLGTLLVLIGVAILSGFTFTTLKLFMLILFIWLANPAAVHIIGRTEVMTNPYIEDECEVIER